MKKKFRNQSKNKTFDFLRYLGPGLLVTVGFIDPGNWASNIAAGSGFGYELLWMVTLSTIMLSFQKFIPFGYTFIFFYRIDIDISQCTDLTF